MKRIAFIATREPGYSRVSIVRAGLHQHFEVDEFVSELKSYKVRLVVIALRVIWAWITFRLRKSDAVFVGFFAQPIFPLVRLLYRGPIIADAYFSLFDTMVNDKQKAKADSWIGKLCFWLDQHMLRTADLCFTDTQEHVKYLKAEFNATEARIRRLWISAESFPLQQRCETIQNDEPFRVFFWGGFIPLQGVDTIVRAAKQLESENVVFTLFGTGQTFPATQALANELHAGNVNFAGWQLPEAIEEEAAISHLALGIFGTTEKAGRVIPNKAYEAMAMGIPLITRSSKAVDELLTDKTNCLLVEPGNADHLANQILWARDNYGEAIAIADRAQELFEQHCDTDAIGVILENEIGDLKIPARNFPLRMSSKNLHKIKNQPGLGSQIGSQRNTT